MLPATTATSERALSTCNLPYDPLREAILLELNRAIGIRRAQGASLEALSTEYGLSKDVLQRIADADEETPEMPAEGQCEKLRWERLVRTARPTRAAAVQLVSAAG